jgi:hypothetical protein
MWVPRGSAARQHVWQCFLAASGELNSKNTGHWMLTTGFDKDEPNTEALSGPQQQQSKAAMDRSLSNLQIKETWQEIKARQDRAKIGARWVLKIKGDAEGSIIK